MHICCRMYRSFHPLLLQFQRTLSTSNALYIGVLLLEIFSLCRMRGGLANWRINCPFTIDHEQWHYSIKQEYHWIETGKLTTKKSNSFCKPWTQPKYPINMKHKFNRNGNSLTSLIWLKLSLGLFRNGVAIATYLRLPLAPMVEVSSPTSCRSRFANVPSWRTLDWSCRCFARVPPYRNTSPPDNHAHDYVLLYCSLCFLKRLC